MLSLESYPNSFFVSDPHLTRNIGAFRIPAMEFLKRLIGESHAQDLVRNFLFDGLDELGSKGFLDYFPEYRREDGSVNEKRSILGKSFENRPWDARGEFIGDDIKI
ncbi:hypothetical protein OIU78_018982 [Salix suchowensis]|nr:hypothetical protein OIU78_018982 [Salix suchowensis]